ncbi:MAG: hypothetical protein ISS67_03280 [Desulfobacterales bacterium]|nr:hypothetical protein [Desulfobacterales bacterium]MBL7207531.1 hypothetical protein [Desulfobacterales bacterium]
MKPGKIINDDNIIRHILINARTIAVVGLSPSFSGCNLVLRIRRLRSF